MWTKSTRIAGKIAIALDFPQLQDFFVGVLRVQEPDKFTYIMELKALCEDGSTPTIPQVKALIYEINFREPSKSDLETLRPLKIFPIKEATGESQLRCLEDTFVIFDRQGHRDTFKDKVASLDFDMEDLRLLRPFFSAFGLDARYTSRLVEEQSRAQDAVREPSLSEDLQRRAYAVFRYVPE